MKRAHEFPSTGRCKMRKTNHSEKGRDYFDRPAKTTVRGSGVSNNHQNQNLTCRTSGHFKENQKFTRPSTSKVPSFHPCTGSSPIHHQSQMRSQYMSPRYPLPRQDRNGNPTMTRFPLRSIYADTFVNPPQQVQHFGHSNYTKYASVNTGYNYERRNWSGSSELEFCKPLHPLNSRIHTYWQRR